jgi:hypothetical protein
VRRRVVLVAAFAAAAVALGAWCGWVSGYHRTSGGAEITWVASTAAVVVVDVALWKGRRHGSTAPPWPRLGRGGGRRALAGVAPWLALVAAAVAWDALGLDTGPRQYHLTISALAQAYRPLNAALLLVWILAGIGYGTARAKCPAPLADTPVAETPARERPAGGASGTASVVGFAGLVTHPAAAAGPALLLPASPATGVAFWIAVPVAAIVIDIVARRSAGSLANGGEFVRFISSAPWADVVLIVAWLGAGYHLFAR